MGQTVGGLATPVSNRPVALAGFEKDYTAIFIRRGVLQHMRNCWNW